MKGKKAAPPPKKKSRAGRPPLVENHPKREEILAAILTPGANMEQIQREFGISRKALETFRGKHVTAATQAMLDRVTTTVPLAAAQLDIVARLDGLLAKCYKMIDAADEWLEDPNAPGKYNLNPRDFEMDVIWEEEVEGERGRMKIIRHRERLADIMKRCGEKGHPKIDEILVVETNAGNNRKLFLDAVNAMKPLAELIGKARGQIKPDTVASINVFLGTPSWAAVEEALTEALKPHPDAATDVGKALARLAEGSDGR